MTQAKVQATLRAGHRDELLSLAALGIAAIGVDLLALRFALLVNVLANSDIGLHSGWRGHGLPTQWADGHLNVLLVGSWTAVSVVAVVRGAEDLVARVALNGQKIWTWMELNSISFCFLVGVWHSILPNLLHVASLQCCPKCGNSMIVLLRLLFSSTLSRHVATDAIYGCYWENFEKQMRL